MKSYKQLSSELNDLHHDIEMNIALLIKKYSLQNILWNCIYYQYDQFTLTPKLGYVEIHFIGEEETSNLINTYNAVQCLDILEQIETYINTNKEIEF